MRTALKNIASWNLNTHKWLLENKHSPWKNTHGRAHMLRKQKWGTYSKSQYMKRFITDAVKHCILTRIWTKSFCYTAYVSLNN